MATKLLPELLMMESPEQPAKQLPNEQEFALVVAQYAEELARLAQAKAVTGYLKNYPSIVYMINAMLLDNSIIELAKFRLTKMPGCNGIVIISGVHLVEEFRGRGIGKCLDRLRVHLLAMYDWPAAMCTTKADDGRQTHILTQIGWNLVQGFHNTNTDHEVNVWLKHLSKSGA